MLNLERKSLSFICPAKRKLALLESNPPRDNRSKGNIKGHGISLSRCVLPGFYMIFFLSCLKNSLRYINKLHLISNTSIVRFPVNHYNHYKVLNKYIPKHKLLSQCYHSHFEQPATHPEESYFLIKQCGCHPVHLTCNPKHPPCHPEPTLSS